jgi:hypothetical protein
MQAGSELSQGLGRAPSFDHPSTRGAGIRGRKSESGKPRCQPQGENEWITAPSRETYRWMMLVVLK